jgi:hypothetical protein
MTSSVHYGGRPFPMACALAYPEMYVKSPYGTDGEEVFRVPRMNDRS